MLAGINLCLSSILKENCGKERVRIAQNKVMSKKNILKIMAIFLTLLVVLPTMTGCGGLGFGEDPQIFKVNNGYDPAKPDKGTWVEVVGPGAGGVLGGGDNGMLKRPLIVYGGGMVDGGIVKNAQVKINILHFAGHFAAVLVGGDGGCPGDVHTCNAGSYAVNLNPLSVCAQALTIGKTIGNAVGGLTGMAMSILITIWFGNMLMSIIREQFTMEALLKSLVQLLCGALIVSNSEAIAGAFLGLFSAGTPSGGTSSFGDAATGAMDGAQFLYFALGVNIPIVQAGVPLAFIFVDDISVILSTVVGAVIVLMAQIQCAISVCSALIPAGIELGLRLKVAPIVFAMSTTTGWGGDMIHYLKSCVACALTPPIICAIVGQAGTIETMAKTLVGTSLLGTAISISLGYKIMSGFVGQARSLVGQAFH